MATRPDASEHPPTHRQRIDFLDLPFDLMTIDETTDWIAMRGAQAPFGYVVTPNVDHMVRLSTAPAGERAAYATADLILCDSRVLAKLARACGIVFPVVPGSDLVARLFRDVLAPGDRICLIGGTLETVARLEALFPALVIEHYDAPPGLRTDPAARTAAARFATAAKARITLVAVGSPQQELIAQEIALDGDARGTALCIGAAVDFITGAQRRAPRAVQRMSLEWAWRLAQNPSRLARRYLIDGPPIVTLVWRWRQRARRN